jgi:hypothetical protein
LAGGATIRTGLKAEVNDGAAVFCLGYGRWLGDNEPAVFNASRHCWVDDPYTLSQPHGSTLPIPPILLRSLQKLLEAHLHEQLWRLNQQLCSFMILFQINLCGLGLCTTISGTAALRGGSVM